jgi:hypothetical protein
MRTIGRARGVSARAEHEIPKLCWICRKPADSGEHIFKARDLKRLFDRDGYAPDDLPFHFHDEGHNRIPGPKSKRMKYPKLICASCNNDDTSKYDRAYDRLSDWFMTQQGSYAITNMDFRKVFGTSYPRGIDALRRYFVKSLGCRILASGLSLPANFPNPVTDCDVSRLQFSICRAQPFRNLENYKPDMMERVLGKGDLYANLSRSHLEATSERKVLGAIWWENIGHFQINYWFNIDADPQFGATVGDLTVTYRIIHCALGLAEMKEAMWAWLSRSGSPPS